MKDSETRLRARYRLAEDGRLPTALLVLLVCSILAAALTTYVVETQVEMRQLDPLGASGPWWRSSLAMGVLAAVLGGLLLGCAVWTYRHATAMLRWAHGSVPDPDQGRRVRMLRARRASRRAVGLLALAGFLVLGGVILPWSLLRLALNP